MMNKPTTQAARREFLINALLDENPQYRGAPIPADETGQRYLLRALMNVRPPSPVSDEILAVQDAYLIEEKRAKTITDAAALVPVRGDLCLWRGDITTLKCGAIVNAANSGMTGCYQPCHSCIDNCIHTFAGMQLRLACADIMRRQGYDEPTGTAKITPAFNLPCRFVIHTVGPIISGDVTARDRELLASCYESCLRLADENGAESIAFCCISTGVFRFPNADAARTALRAVESYKARTLSTISVVFNVFGDKDEAIYRQLLTANS